MSFIECIDLTHIYNAGMENELLAVENVNINIEEGEFVAILGTNGSGKSTLAKHFNGLLVPSTGKCLVDGMDTADEILTYDIRKQIGMVFQNPDNQIIAAIVEDDVGFGPENIGLDPHEIRRNVTAALRAVDMEEFRYFSPHHLSGGQKQRVAIAGALAMNTRCLVLDEPTAMLDPRGRHEVMDTVSRLNKERGITTIYITHFMEEAALADRIFVMDQKHLVASGTPREIFRDIGAMKKRGLAVPMAAEIAYRLQQKGVRIDESIINTEDLVRALCQ
ncbi:energy-coupling factor transporter ATPase [Anaerovibrio sp. RM50]|uniref:energy-coupling factor transporter ATPase n=1 Tax=Anaerovibrio sp. RM50 TaxID=1200557 RepID=UPI00048678D7|nr:energy-coupling factor transporter ATPase [Anaerovibrio sp. RM50]